MIEVSLKNVENLKKVEAPPKLFFDFQGCKQISKAVIIATV